MKREQLLKKRLTTEQQWILFNHSALSRRLPEDHYQEMEGLMHVFWHEVKFESHGVDEITEEMRVLVAAEACILIILLGYEKYRYLKKVEIHGKYIDSKDGIKAAGTGGRRVVQLVWSSTIEGSQHGTDNYNVILHEFAHVIDQAPYGRAESIPVGINSVDYEEWKAVLDQEYTKLQEAFQSGEGHTLNEYSISCDSKAEFFTCATEAFFERSTQLHSYNHEIYRLLSNFYGLDPVSWNHEFCPGCFGAVGKIVEGWSSCSNCGWPGRDKDQPPQFHKVDTPSHGEQLHSEEPVAELPPILKQLTSEQRKILTDHSALYNRLPGDLKIRLEGLMHVFLREVAFEVDGFSEVTEEMRICVAAEACVLILSLGYDSYSQLRGVTISRDALKWDGKDWGGLAGRHEVSLYWDQALNGMRWGSDNRNVILHEFAHVLDQADDATAQSIPVAVDSLVDRVKWEQVIDQEYPKIKAAYAEGRAHTIRDYSLTDNAEFFSCATESFFERSKELHQHNPEIYELLQDYYGLDPVRWKPVDEEADREAKRQRALEHQLTLAKTLGSLLVLIIPAIGICFMGLLGHTPWDGILFCFMPIFLFLFYCWWLLAKPTIARLKADQAESFDAKTNLR